VRLVRRGRSPTEEGFTLLVLGDVAVRQDDHEAARQALDQARALLRGAITPHLHEAAAAIEAALGARARRPASGDELTDRELAVLRRLTGDGSARDIAADLYVSHNTVKTQIRAIYRKLGVATRDEAVARARERGLLARS
jgi:LuxR family maltose regulon positive regulatory protein